MVARVRALLQRFCGVFAASLSPQIAAFLALASRGSLALGGSADRRNAGPGAPTRAVAGDIHVSGLTPEAFEVS